MRILSLLLSVSVLLVTAGTCPADPGVPCPGTCIVWAEEYLPCIGDTIGIYVIVRDCYGMDLPGKVVDFYSMRGADDTIIGSPGVTDAHGFAEAKMTTAIPGDCQFYVICQSVVLSPGRDIQWSGASPVESTTWGRVKTLFK
jgi:hypothetical protein